MSAPGAVLSYVYAVTRNDVAANSPPGGADELYGIGGSPVRWVAAGGLRAVVGDVDREQFVGPGLSERLEDLAWLAATARAHHHVVDVVGRARLVAPLSLATVYFDDDRVRGVLVDGWADFDAVLSRLAGRSEFGLKVHARRGEHDEPAGRPSSGAAYLRGRRDALRNAETATERARAAAEEIDRVAAGLAVDTRTHRLQDATLSGTEAPMVLNRAYLVPVERASELAALVETVADHSRVTVQLTGPWVPYSFAQAVGS